MKAGIIYYTDNRVIEPIFYAVQKLLLEAELPIINVSLKPTPNFGTNIVLDAERSYPTMVKQILMALEASTADFVFFCENDVLYHKTHFDFVPAEDNIFYYNKNVWRWLLDDDKAIRYEGMWPLSCLCVNREFALKHYRYRMKKIIEWGLDEFRSREPRKARIWGYEPGTKPRRRGGFTNDKCQTWSSELPNIDIRHKRTFSSPKVTLDSFRKKPANWQEINIKNIDGWNLSKMNLT